MANKITKKEVITMMLENEVIRSNQTFVDYLENELVLLQKKAARVSEKKSNANDDLKKEVVETLKLIGSGTVTDIMKASAVLGELSNQKVTAVIRTMLGIEVQKTIDKKKSLFSLIEEVAE